MMNSLIQSPSWKQAWESDPCVSLSASSSRRSTMRLTRCSQFKQSLAGLELLQENRILTMVEEQLRMQRQIRNYYDEGIGSLPMRVRSEDEIEDARRENSDLQAMAIGGLAFRTAPLMQTEIVLDMVHRFLHSDAWQRVRELSAAEKYGLTTKQACFDASRGPIEDQPHRVLRMVMYHLEAHDLTYPLKETPEARVLNLLIQMLRSEAWEKAKQMDRQATPEEPVPPEAEAAETDESDLGPPEEQAARILAMLNRHLELHDIEKACGPSWKLLPEGPHVDSQRLSVDSQPEATPEPKELSKDVIESCA